MQVQARLLNLFWCIVIEVVVTSPALVRVVRVIPVRGLVGQLTAAARLLFLLVFLSLQLLIFLLLFAGLWRVLWVILPSLLAALLLALGFLLLLLRLLVTRVVWLL